MEEEERQMQLRQDLEDSWSTVSTLSTLSSLATLFTQCTLSTLVTLFTRGIVLVCLRLERKNWKPAEVSRSAMNCLKIEYISRSTVAFWFRK